MNLRELLRERRGTQSYRSFAKEIGIDHSRLYKFLNQSPENDVFGLPTIRHLARQARSSEDQILIDSLADYALWGDTIGEAQ